MLKYKLRLLTFDGGGVQNLLTFQILKQLMEITNMESPLKFYNYFDIIKSTSTSGSVNSIINITEFGADK